MPPALPLLIALAAATAPAAGAPCPPRDAAGATAAGPAAADAETAATAGADPALRDRIESYLGVIDRPVTPEAWRELGPGACPLLAAVAADPGELPSRRAVALEGLAALGGAGAAEMHLDAARSPDAPRLVRHAAVRGLAGLVPPERLAREVRPLLDDPDAGLQAAAADALSRGASRQGCAAIRARATRPVPAAASGRFAAALERCGP